MVWVNPRLMVFRHLPRVPHYSVVVNIMKFYRHDRDSNTDRCCENQTCQPLHHRQNHYSSNNSNFNSNFNRSNNFNQTNQDSCLIHKSAQHNTRECNNYLHQSNEEKVNLLKENNACFCCLVSGHRSSQCNEKQICTIPHCGKYHHHSLHEAHTAGMMFHSVINSESDFPLNLVSCPSWKSAQVTHILKQMFCRTEGLQIAI